MGLFNIEGTRKVGTNDKSMEFLHHPDVHPYGGAQHSCEPHFQHNTGASTKLLSGRVQNPSYRDCTSKERSSDHLLHDQKAPTKSAWKPRFSTIWWSKFSKRGYQSLISLKTDLQSPHFIESRQYNTGSLDVVVDTGAGTNIMSSLGRPLSWQAHVSQFYVLKLETSTWNSLYTRFHLRTHLYRRLSSHCIIRYRGDPCGESTALGSFIKWSIHDIFSTDQKVVSIHSWTMAILTDFPNFMSVLMGKNIWEDTNVPGSGNPKVFHFSIMCPTSVPWDMLCSITGAFSASMLSVIEPCRDVGEKQQSMIARKRMDSFWNDLFNLFHNGLTITDSIYQ